MICQGVASQQTRTIFNIIFVNFDASFQRFIKSWQIQQRIQRSCIVYAIVQIYVTFGTKWSKSQTKSFYIYNTFNTYNNGKWNSMKGILEQNTSDTSRFGEFG